MNILNVIRDELYNDPELVGYSTMDDHSAYNSLIEERYVAPKLILTKDIQKYLVLNGLLLSIEDSSLLSARNAKRNMEIFNGFDMSEGVVAYALTNTLQALVDDGLITVQDKETVLSLGETKVSRSNILGIQDLKIGHVIDARSS